MRLYDCEQSAQHNILDSGQEEEEYNYEDDKPKKSFEGFKFYSVFNPKRINFERYEHFRKRSNDGMGTTLHSFLLKI